MTKVGKLVNDVAVDTQKFLKGAVGAERALKEFEDGCAAEAEQRGRGRPKGSANREVDVVDSPVTSCQKCGGTRRAPYFNLRMIPTTGIDRVTGQVYVAVEYRRTKCLDCGQHRDDRTLVNEPKRIGKK